MDFKILKTLVILYKCWNTTTLPNWKWLEQPLLKLSNLPNIFFLWGINHIRESHEKIRIIDLLVRENASYQLSCDLSVCLIYFRILLKFKFILHQEKWKKKRKRKIYLQVARKLKLIFNLCISNYWLTCRLLYSSIAKLYKTLLLVFR